MTIFGFEMPEDAMFHGMSGKPVTESQEDLLAILCEDVGSPIDVLGVVATEMKHAGIDRQVASVTISLIKGGGKPLSVLRHRLAERVHGQGGLF